MYSPLVRYLDRRLYPRKLVHMSGGVVSAALVLRLPPQWCVVLAVSVIILYWSISKRVSLALFAPIVLLGLTRSRLVVAAAFIILALGDGSSALLGCALGRKHWRWHPAKTVEGSVAFILTAGVGMLGLLWLQMPTVPLFPYRMLLAVVPVLGGCLAECLPIEITQNGKPDDNLGVMLAGGVVFYLLCLWLRIDMMGML